MTTMVFITWIRTMRFLLCVVLFSNANESLGFTARSVARRPPFRGGAAQTTRLRASTDSQEAFPVLKKIAGCNWEGSCRYVSEDLKPASFELTGGIRFDLPGPSDDNDIVEMNSFIVFPNGKRRDIQMRGSRGSLQRSSMRLESTAGDGPIYTIITELGPDTVLVNEVSKETGMVVMTSSLSLVVQDGDGGAATELIQVSHEVGAPAAANKSAMIEGHQVWRFSKQDESSWE
ncbi:unnamed protein product [Pseudo-nitzschia multistriata]|uniref:Uncharacterized protein n=1 Tax=Pseudo-nitzschia multistriata TaxID=183589 RepID=A0A448Z9Y8_9STRA|nr:unnamed protein product [Pseudo-nitzschia multistriata]